MFRRLRGLASGGLRHEGSPSPDWAETRARTFRSLPRHEEDLGARHAATDACGLCLASALIWSRVGAGVSSLDVVAVGGPSHRVLVVTRRKRVPRHRVSWRIGIALLGHVSSTRTAEECNFRMLNINFNYDVMINHILCSFQL